ncbi:MULTISPECIES: hypothetical protein [unclassified Streptomyces]|uniref:hypothetical protein n=1 Tax=unclassified Streptomyces TaxID=2593676 RepID=UPI00117E70F8|nr:MULTISPECIES: hypothetical protein [unclassified Streptomyces]MDI1455809.1 hypothetical protein [Streptomyces sp. ATE26]
MASTTDLMSLRAVRQLRRIRAFYAVGALLWAASTAWTAWHSPGSRQMWVSALLLIIFTGLLAAAALWLQRCQAAAPARPVHHAASSKASGPRHAHA